MDNRIKCFILSLPIPLYFFFHLFSNTRIDIVVLSIITIALIILVPVGLYQLVKIPGITRLIEHKDDASNGSKISIRSVIIMAVTAILSMGVFTQSSPLYPMNLWSDSNIYFTVAKAMVNGQVLYRDIFDLKGPYIFFVYSLGVRLCDTSFIGIYLIEVICCFLVLFFTYKIVRLYTKTSIITDLVIVCLSLGVYSTFEFVFGGCPEELLMPIYVATLYFGLKAIKESRPTNCKEAFIVGMLAGLVFWTKYTLCGIFLGFALFILVEAVKNKEWKKLRKVIAAFLGGFAVTTVPVLLYFVISSDLGVLFKNYFYDNLFVYAAARDDDLGDMPLPVRVVYTMVFYYSNCDIDIFILTFLGSVFFFFKEKIRGLAFILMLIAGSVLGVYISGHNYAYYPLILYTFCVTAMVPICGLLEKHSVSKRQKSIAVTSLVIIVAAAAVLGFNRSQSTYLIFTPKDNVPQYRFAKIINSSDDTTLINFANFDLGFYFASDTLPFNRIYNYSPDEYEFCGGEQLALLQNREAHFYIASYNYPPFDGYVLIDEATLDTTFTGRTCGDAVYYLYERVD